VDPTLSEQLKQYADERERDLEEGLSPEEREETRSTRRYAFHLAEYIVMSREVLAKDGLSQLDSFVHHEEDAVARILDEHYVLRQIEKVPSMVRRTLRFSRLSAQNTPSAQTNRYISEAIRAYIQGFAIASVAISRAALEQALKERLKKQGNKVHSKFGNLANEARKQKLLSPAGYDAAIELAKECNAVLHERPLDDEEAALTILFRVRSLLEELYSTNGLNDQS
jgi:hypothetical protein